MSCLLQRIFLPAILLMCSCLSPLALFAQPTKATGSVAGRITDGESPTPGITVTATRDVAFQLKQLALGKYWLLVLPSEPSVFTTYDATARAKLLKRAAAEGKELTLAPCQRVTQFQLP